MEEKYKEAVVQKAGSSAVFEIPFSAHPSPAVTWTYKNKPLTSSKRISFETIGGMTALTLSKLEKGDAGIYTVTIQNNLGKVSSDIEVIIIGKSSSF